jgi:hypothetical protein
MEKTVAFFIILVRIATGCTQMKSTSKIEMSGNPVFPGWYADPEGIIFG